MFGSLAGMSITIGMFPTHWYTIQSMIHGVALFSLAIQTPLFSFLSQRLLHDRA